MLTFNILLAHLCSCLFFYISDKDKALILCHCLVGYVCEELLFFFFLNLREQILPKTLERGRMCFCVFWACFSSYFELNQGTDEGM